MKGIDQTMAAGRYNVVTDETLIEGLSHLAWRRVSTMIFLPTPSWFEMVAIDPADLHGALERDALQAADPSMPGAPERTGPESRTS